MNWFGVLQQFKTGIVGVIGFTGVIITLVTNAALARSARAAVVSQERETLRTALIVELTMLRDAYAQNAEYCAKEAGKSRGHVRCSYDRDD
jgi:hypothetical protein